MFFKEINLIYFAEKSRSNSNESGDCLVTEKFKDSESAGSAFDGAPDCGYSKDELSMMMCDETRELNFTSTTADKENNFPAWRRK